MAEARNPSTAELVLLATIDNIKTLVATHAPSGASRDFLLWALAEDNPQRNNYLQLTGVYKLAELGTYWLKDIIDTNITQQLARYLGALNAYFFFEVISDNLAIGLASIQTQDQTKQNRKKILLHFNKIMQQKLAGEKTTTLSLLAPVTEQINTISCFEQSLASNETREITKAYLEQFPKVSMHELEHSALTYLTLNVESCLHATQLLSDHPVLAQLEQGLSSRYAAVSELLENDRITDLTVLANNGTQSILVIPTLLYIISTLEKITPNPDLLSIIQNGFLMKALKKASCIIRLLNDIGTNLLTLSEQEKAQLLTQFQQNFSLNQGMSSLEFLGQLAESKQFNTLLARIRKDIHYGEFNICLNNLRHISDGNKALMTFFDNLHFYSTLYKQLRAELMTSLEEITQNIKDIRISQLILKMVTFHEVLYAKEFEHNQGDYATKR